MAKKKCRPAVLLLVAKQSVKGLLNGKNANRIAFFDFEFDTEVERLLTWQNSQMRESAL